MLLDDVLRAPLHLLAVLTVVVLVGLEMSRAATGDVAMVRRWAPIARASTVAAGALLVVAVARPMVLG
jgi:uncharacterized membrane protein